MSGREIFMKFWENDMLNGSIKVMVGNYGSVDASNLCDRHQRKSSFSGVANVVEFCGVNPVKPTFLNYRFVI